MDKGFGSKAAVLEDVAGSTLLRGTGLKLPLFKFTAKALGSEAQGAGFWVLSSFSGI